VSEKKGKRERKSDRRLLWWPPQSGAHDASAPIALISHFPTRQPLFRGRNEIQLLRDFDLIVSCALPRLRCCSFDSLGGVSSGRMPPPSPMSSPYYSNSPFTRRPSSSFGTPLLGSARRISIRTPILGSPGGSLHGGVPRGRRRKILVGGALLLVLVAVSYVWKAARNGDGRFLQVGGFGLDYMGREEETSTGAKRLKPVQIGGGISKSCLLFPWRYDCIEEAKQHRDPFEGLVFKEESGRLYYPAVQGPPPLLRPGEKPPSGKVEPPDPSKQPHPIHHLVRKAKKTWKAKVQGQSKNLEEAITEYERRYARRPPKGFGEW
jgi:hypothetical protein